MGSPLDVSDQTANDFLEGSAQPYFTTQGGDS
jgi:hypothetical protein